MVGIMVGIMQLPLIIPCNFGTMNLSYRAAALAPQTNVPLSSQGECNMR